MWRRPWVIFGLVVFTILVATICLFGSAIVRVQRQHAILMQIETLGGGYTYTPTDDWGIPFAWQIPREVQVEVRSGTVDLPAILDLTSKLIDVQHLKLTGATRLGETQLAQIASLRNLTHLAIENTDFTDEDLLKLLVLSKLEEVSLRATQVTDRSLAEFTKFPALKTLDLRDTPLTYEQVVRWQQAHPSCVVSWRPPLSREQRDIVTQLGERNIRIYGIANTGVVEPTHSWHIMLGDQPRVWPLLQRLGGIKSLQLISQQYVDWDLLQVAQLQTVERIELILISSTPEGIAALAKLPNLQAIAVNRVDAGLRELLALRQTHPDLQILLICRSGPQHPKRKPTRWYGPPYEGVLNWLLEPQEL